MFERSSASVDRETGAEAGLRSKRTASAHGLNMSAEGRTGHITPRPRHKYRNLPHPMGVNSNSISMSMKTIS